MPRASLEGKVVVPGVRRLLEANVVELRGVRGSKEFHVVLGRVEVGLRRA